MTRSCFRASVLALLLSCGPVLAADWPQFGFDAAHSGNNPVETRINAANVSQLVLLYAKPIFPYGGIDSAPVYASGIATSGGVRDLLFAFGANGTWDGQSSLGTLFAFDAATGEIVWSKQSMGSSQHASSAPAIDPNRQYVYSFGLDGYVHKYKIGDGTEIVTVGPMQFGWPVRVTLKPNQEKVASGLTIASLNGSSFLEVVTNGYDGDGGDYQGHLVSINLDTAAQNVFNVMCSNLTHLLDVYECPDRMSGIWGRGGATFDVATNRIYVTTGNGHYTANAGGFDWGDSVLALPIDGSSTGGAPQDSYTPGNFQNLDYADQDLGSVSLAILPVSSFARSARHLGVQGGKDYWLRLIDLDDMSGAGAPAHVGGELQILGQSTFFSQPAVWIDPGDGSTWLFTGDYAAGIRLEQNGGQSGLSVVWSTGSRITSPVVANGVVFYLAGAYGSLASMAARDALTGNLLWQSPLLDNTLHWQSPIIIDGALYVFDMSTLYKFGPDHIFADGFDR